MPVAREGFGFRRVYRCVSMTEGSQMQRSPRAGDRRHTGSRARLRPAVALLVAGAAGLATASLSGLALASSSPRLGTAHTAQLGQVVIDNAHHGFSVYMLGGDSTSNRLCTKANGCFGTWPPVTVASAKTKVTVAPGVKGKITIVHHDGVFQVVLAKHPLYTYSGDSSKAQTNYDGFKDPTFHGTWHVVKASGSTKKTTQTTQTTGTPSMGGNPPYHY
jgi:predicted lipoprotein with Yx(FWY)xxD motif